ncbi:MAG: S-layer homology domain-containing protein [Clostridia bacterium]|nr:S-layer homology domain-containing protein [Clostridia bacterium]
MKKFLSVMLSVLLLSTAFTFTLGANVSAASKGLDLGEINKGGKSGFVDNVSVGTLEVVTEDGRKALKFTPDPASENAGKPAKFEGNGFSKLGVSYDTYRYMSIEYKYQSKKPAYSGAFQSQLCNSNKVFAAGGGVVTGTPIVASGKWETAYFDLTPIVDGRLAEDKDVHTINHIHVNPFGSTPASKLDPDDVIFIGKITFSEENLQPGGVTTEAPKVEEKPAAGSVETPTTTETPAYIGEGSASPKVVGEGDVIVDAVKLLHGPVDKADIGTYEEIKVGDRSLVKFTPNPGGKDNGKNISFDAYGLSGNAGKELTFEEYSFITVEYYYAATEPKYNKNLSIFTANSTKVFKSGAPSIMSSEPIVAGKWTVAYFYISDAVKKLLKEDMDIHPLNHIHVSPFNTAKPSSLTVNDVIYIGKIGFHKSNPNPKTEYIVTYAKNGVGVPGDDIPSATVALGAEVTLPECPWDYKGFKFMGWLVNGKTMQPGEKFTASGDEDIKVAASWVEAVDAENNSKGFPYATINDGVIVDFVGAVTTEKVVEDGYSAVKATPVPEFRKNDKATNMGLENLSLNNKIRVDLDVYKYATVTYKYVSPNPLTDVVKVPHLSLTRNSGMFTKTGMGFKPIENTELRVNQWTTVLYEFPNLEGIYANPDAQHILIQFHLQPFGSGVTNDKVTANDIVYVQGMTFHKEKPASVEIAVPYITGFEDGSFGLGQTMTRAQACTVVARLIAGGDANVPAGASAFTDVAEADWFAKYIAYCEAKGLLKSYSGTFLPNQAITRAEFVELVYNMGLLADAGKNGTFTDVPADHPRAAVVSAAGKAGLVNGYANGDGTFSFKPDNTISREEVVTVINNAYGRKSDKEYLANGGYGEYFTDVDEAHWAFPAIIDASVLHLACRENGADTDLWLYNADVSGQLAFTDEDYAAAEAKVAEVDALTEKRIAEIKSTKTTVEVTGTKYYFAADGNDANDGLSPEKPKKTLAAVNALALKSGDGVYFKRGDIFRGQITAKAGVTYTAYGEGEKPKLYASPANFAGADNWEQTEVANVWKLKTPIMHDVGLVVFNEGEAWTEKRIKGRPDFKEGGLENLDKDLTMWHDVANPTDTEGYVYVRSDKGNPGALYNSIELNPRSHVIRVGASNVTIDNLCIKYTGAHGVSSGGVKNLVVTNCEFGFIGGSWFRTDTLSRYGNAVEIYGAVDGYVVDNCYIYHCYDAGVTHQLTQSPDTECIMADVHYTNNVITYTTYPVEYFINDPNPGVTHAYLGLEISDNIIRYTGYGFGDQRPDKTAAAGIKSWNTYNAAEDFVMNNNIFDRSKYMLIQLGASSPAWLPLMDGNTYIIDEGANFGNIGHLSEGNATVATQKYVEVNSKDKNAKVYVLRKKKIKT